jgi:hypothetical protein
MRKLIVKRPAFGILDIGEVLQTPPGVEQWIPDVPQVHKRLKKPIQSIECDNRECCPQMELREQH